MFFVPPTLRRWFVAHFIIDLLLGVPALLFPGLMLQLFGFPPTEQFTTRMLGAGLLGMGGAIFLMRDKGIISYRTMLNIKIIWSFAAIGAIGVTFYFGESKRVLFFLPIFVILVLAWVYYRVKMKG